MFVILVMIDYKWEFFGSYPTKREAEEDLLYWKMKYPLAIFKIVEE